MISSNVVIGSVDTKAANLEAMKDKRIAAEVGSVHVNQAKQYSQNVITCSSAEEALKLVMDKKADFAIVDNHTAGFFITNFYNGKLTVMAELPGDKDKGIGIAVKPTSANRMHEDRHGRCIIKAAKKQMWYNIKKK